MRKIYPLMFCLLFSATLVGQVKEKCASAYVFEREMQNNPEFRKNQEDLERFTEKYVHTHREGQKTLLLTIPVVVHVIYKTAAQNISDATINDAIETLNEDYRKEFGTPGYNGTHPLAADVEIEFALATKNPSGGSTTGITRTSTSQNSFDPTGNDMKFNSSGGKDIWDRDDYLNIWVCNIATDAGGVVGRAEFPGAAANIDGIIVDYRWFGNGERTATHEVGHWLNLRHIWGDGPCFSDFVNDTPTHLYANTECIDHPVVCSVTSPLIRWENIENYMDYTPSSCQNMFTYGQKDRMHACINGTRSSLKTSSGFLKTPDNHVMQGSLTGISSNSTGSVKAYPNPSKGMTTFEIGNGYHGEMLYITVYNAVGQMVGSFERYAADNRVELDLSSLNAEGIFHINLRGDELNLTFPLMISSAEE